MADSRKSKRPGSASALVLSAILLIVGIGIVFLRDPLTGDFVAVCLLTAAWLLPVLLVVRARARIGTATRADLYRAEKAVVAKVEEARAKGSRHEYHQELTLSRIEKEIGRLRVLNEAESIQISTSRTDVLFVTSNGAGLGHISRLLAISAKLPPDRKVEFLTMSTAYRQVADSGVRINYFPSSDAAGEPPATWNPVFRSFFRELVHKVRPRVVVFDGTWVYTGITDVCRALGIPLVWVQRGLWKQDVDGASIQRHNANAVADHVLVPGDFAGPEQVDVGEDLKPQYVGPIVMTSQEDLLGRDEACRSMGLDPAHRYVLLNLGGGSISDPNSIARAALREVQQLAPHLVPVQVVSPLADAGDEVPGLTRVSAYPVMPAARAFDMMIAAAGYNSAQEAVSLGIPSILVPNSETKTDDQVLRARGLSERAMCLVAETEGELRNAIGELADPVHRAAMRERLARVDPPRGAAEAASIIDSIFVQANWPMRADMSRGRDE